MSEATEHGQIVASYGQRGLLAGADGDPRPYLLKGRKLRAVCGDIVEWQTATDDDAVVVTGVRPRRNALERPDARGKAELLAANLDRIVVVLAPSPAPDYFLADRFLCAAAQMQAGAVIVWNKADLEAALPPAVENYRAIGHDVLSVSARDGTGIDALAGALGSGISMLVGQSGVGKSSLINRLGIDSEVLTRRISESTGEGRHTTTASFMHSLPGGGKLIDSPGVREFAPRLDQEVQAQNGFREIVAIADKCRFSNCLHVREPQCAVKEAVANGTISERRYESYKRLRNMTRVTRVTRANRPR